MADGFADGVVAGMASNDRCGYGYPMMPMVPAYGGGFGNSGFGCNGDWIWIIFLFALFCNGGFGGFGGNNMGAFPWIMQGQNNTDNNVNAGFDHAATASALSNIQNSLTTGFSNAEIANCGRTIDSINRSFDSQSAITSAINNVNTGLLNFCCENRAGLADLKYAIATESCSNRQAINEGVRDIIASQTAGTQRILDQICQDKIDSKNDTIYQLRQELMYSREQANMVEQTARILAGQNNNIDALYNRLSNCPVPSTPVYGRNPIFTCSNNGCVGGCGNTNI